MEMEPHRRKKESRIDNARTAYKNGDKKELQKLHTVESIRHQEHHNSEGGKYIKDLVYGGLDGIITTFAIVSGVAGANLSSSVILILGVANLLADGFSMAGL